MAEPQRPIARGIGWDGKRAKQMLEESERLFAETGRYQGLGELSLKDKDPIGYEKIFSRLRGGMVNARETALNISASPIVREIGELCFALYTPEGDSITLSTGIMVHVHTMSDAIKWMIRQEYEENPGIHDGDIFANNDAFIGDVHNADVQNIVPIFFDGELIGWAAGVTHVIDVGAPLPSGMPMGPIHRFEDGFMLSCQKVGSRDRLHRDYELRCQTAVRLPMYWMLDEKTRIAGCHMIRSAVQGVIEDVGVATYKRFVREVIEDGRLSFIERIKELTVPGKYVFPTFTDVTFGGEKTLPPHAAKDTLMHAPLELTIGAEGEFEVSFDGASRWGYHSFNAPPSAMQGGLWVLLTQLVIPNDKVNDGAYFATKLHLPHGSWCNPDNLFCSVSISWVYLIPAYTGIFRGLSTAFAARGYVEEVVAGYPFTSNMAQGGGLNHYGQEGGWTNFEHSCCGISAGWVKDGEGACAAMWNPEGDMGDVEAWEILEPLLYLGRRIRPNSYGPGKFRGGFGFEAIRMVHGTPEQGLYNLGEGYVFNTNGLFGGYPTYKTYRHSVKKTDMKERIAKQLPYPVYDADPENTPLDHEVKGSEIVRDQRCIHTPDPHGEYDLYLSVLRGGNGLGDVLERDPDLIADDLNEGFLLPRFLDSIYGAVAVTDGDGKFSVDREATAKRRAEKRQERLTRSVPVKEWIAAERERVVRADFVGPVKQMYDESMTLSPAWAHHFRQFWDLPESWNPKSGLDDPNGEGGAS